MKRDYSYIDSDRALAELCAKLESVSHCAIDTEFVRESTYYAELALVQVGSGDLFACIDPLAIDDFSPFVELLANPALVKVFHSSSQDLEILYQRFDVVPAPVFDTQLAAAVLGDEVLLGHEGGAGGGVLGRGRQVRDGGGEAGVLASLQ